MDEGPQIGPTRNPMVWIYGQAADGLTCPGCRHHDGRRRKCALRASTIEAHASGLPACGRFDRRTGIVTVTEQARTRRR